MAEVLGEISRWQGYLHDLGDVEVKQGMRIHLFNLFSEDLGNEERPSKLRSKDNAAVQNSSNVNYILSEIMRHKRSAFLVLAALVVTTSAGYFTYSRYYLPGKSHNESPAEELPLTAPRLIVVRNWVEELRARFTPTR